MPGKSSRQNLEELVSTWGCSMVEMKSAMRVKPFNSQEKGGRQRCGCGQERAEEQDSPLGLGYTEFEVPAG